MANYNQNSIVDYLKSQGRDSSYSARKQLASELGISNYTGSASQNTQILNALKNGTGTNNNQNNTPTVAVNAPEAATSAAASVVDADKTKATGKPKANGMTNETAAPSGEIKGVDAKRQEQMESQFTETDASKGATQTAADALHKVNKLTNTDSIISDSTRDAMNSSFTVPGAVKAADQYLAEQLTKIQSGKTSYSDQLQEMMDKIMNRDKFSYDVDQDPLFQQALASATNSGKQAMQDTIGQASALTGGYGSTYATTAGNQAYNAFIEDAYDNLPQYYQMALEAYQMEGDEMYRQYGMLSDADDKEFNRYLSAYDATSQYRNRLYVEAYSQHRDKVSDAYNMANLELNEHGQLVSDAYNYYNAASNYADTLYEREYTKWADEINMAYKYAEMLNSDWWNQTEFDENVRQYDTTLAENKRQFDAQLSYQKARDAAEAARWEKEFAETVRMNDAQLAKMNSSGGGGGGGGRRGSSGGGGGNGKPYSLTDSQINSLEKVYRADGEDGVLTRLQAWNKVPTTEQGWQIIDAILSPIAEEEYNRNETYNLVMRGRDFKNPNAKWGR